MFGGLELIGCRLINRRHHRIGCKVSPIFGMQSHRFRVLVVGYSVCRRLFYRRYIRSRLLVLLAKC